MTLQRQTRLRRGARFLNMLSIVIPARDEEQCLPSCLASIAQARTRVVDEVEVVVVLNRCTDRTEEIARAAGCIIVRDNRKNLAMIRNSGAAAAQGEILVTIDADSTMTENMLERIVRALASDRVVGGGVLIVPERWSFGILITGLYLLPIALFHRISGGLFFCRRSDFTEIGGFDESLASVEDIDFARRLKRHGRATGRVFVHLFRAWIVTSCRKFDHFGDWYFVLRPWLVWKLLKGRNQAAADRVWYDFSR